MTTSLDKPIDVPVVASKDGFHLHKPFTRASTLGILDASPRPLRSHSNVLQRAHTITPSGSAKRSNRALTDRARKPHQRASSLLRVKGSNERLPQRLLVHEMTSADRKDNNFAVANVGNNGKLYLR